MKYLYSFKLLIVLTLLSCLLPIHSNADPPDEGMWLPASPDQLNIAGMQALGLTLPAGEIYSESHPSMKDAVCLFANNCTGSVISAEGLLITNLHCAGGKIKSLSSDTTDYLAHGFWAKNRGEELPCPGLNVTFLISMTDVTDSVMGVLNDTMTEFNRNWLIDSFSVVMARKAVRGTPFSAQVKSFFNGNRFYLMMMQTFRDVRLVGSPPVSIGDFGKETDNWSWPRQAADFALFRIYAGADNKPAEFSAGNLPYKPAWHFPVSLQVVEENDFTMVLGFPGRTNEYATSYAIDFLQNVSYAEKILINETKLTTWSEAMARHDSSRLRYQSDYDATTSVHKKMQGEVYGLKRAGVIAVKEKYEQEFTRRLKADTAWQKEYGSLLPALKAAYDSISQLQPAIDYYDVVLNTELLTFAASFQALTTAGSHGAAPETLSAAAASLLKDSHLFFSHYDRTTDVSLLSSIISLWSSRSAWTNVPATTAAVMHQYPDGTSFMKHLLDDSFLDEEESVYDFLKNYKRGHAKKLSDDPLYQFTLELLQYQDKQLIPLYDGLRTRLAMLNRRYMAAQMEVMKEQKFYPDANLTFRIAYGKVQSLPARDGITYNFYTTLDGVMEKNKSGSKDYEITPRLRELYDEKNYGSYADASGKLHTCFLATNHTTGGNSGSPVTDGAGNLIGINFDRVWEATMSDLYYDPDQCRNISLDIRYALFIIEIYAGAGYLLREMTLIQ